MRETIDSFDVVGLPLRTSNREAARTIPPHWRAAADAGLLAPEKPGVGPGIYAVYTDYETPGDDVDGRPQDVGHGGGPGHSPAKAISSRSHGFSWVFWGRRGSGGV